MSDIEDRASRYAGGLIQGRGRDLRPEAQEAIAAWAVLKAMVFEHAHEGEQVLVPERHYRQMYERKGLPDSTWVWIGRVDPDSAPDEGPTLALLASQAMFLGGPAIHPPGAPPNGYVTTISVNQLVLTVFGHDLAGAPGMLHGDDVGPALRRIWPIDQEILRWPFEPTLTVRGLQRLAVS